MRENSLRRKVMLNRASDLKIKYEKLAEEFENIRRKFGG